MVSHGSPQGTCITGRHGNPWGSPWYLHGPHGSQWAPPRDFPRLKLRSLVGPQALAIAVEAIFKYVDCPVHLCRGPFYLPTWLPMGPHGPIGCPHGTPWPTMGSHGDCSPATSRGKPPIFQGTLASLLVLGPRAPDPCRPSLSLRPFRAPGGRLGDPWAPKWAWVPLGAESVSLYYRPC